MQATRTVRTLAATLSIAIVALALMGAAWRGEPAPVAETATPMVGVPTGEFVNGVEVQRLPSITVTARRSDAQQQSPDH